MSWLSLVPWLCGGSRCCSQGLPQPHISIISIHLFDACMARASNTLIHPTHTHLHTKTEQQQQRRPRLGFSAPAAAMATNKPAGHDSKSFPPSIIRPPSLPPSLTHFLTFPSSLHTEKDSADGSASGITITSQAGAPKSFARRDHLRYVPPLPPFLPPSLPPSLPPWPDLLYLILQFTGTLRRRCKRSGRRQRPTRRRYVLIFVYHRSRPVPLHPPLPPFLPPSTPGCLRRRREPQAQVPRDLSLPLHEWTPPFGPCLLNDQSGEEGREEGREGGRAGLTPASNRTITHMYIFRSLFPFFLSAGVCCALSSSFG